MAGWIKGAIRERGSTRKLLITNHLGGIKQNLSLKTMEC